MKAARATLFTLLCSALIGLPSASARAQRPSAAQVPDTAAAQAPVPGPALGPALRIDPAPGTDPARVTVESSQPTPAVQDDAPTMTTDDDPCHDWSRRRHPVLRVGQDYRLARDEVVRDVIVVSGTATIDGRVCGDLTVGLGIAHLSDTAVVQGSLIVIGGSATAQPGSVVRDDLLVIGGSLDAPSELEHGRQHLVIGTPVLGDRVRNLVPWLTEGLLIGRLIVPRLLWVWYLVGVVFLVSLLLNLLFPHASGSSADAIAAKPLSTFLVGLLVLLLAGPVSVVLAVSVIGLAVVPFLFCAMLIAWIIGKIGVARWIGTRVVGQDEPHSRAQSTRSFVIGFVALCLAYMVPVLGIVVWTMTGVLGLGAAFLAFIKGFRSENPSAPGRPRAAVVAPPLPAAENVDSLLDPTPRVPPADALTGADLSLFPRASFLERLAAFALDVALVLIADGLLNFTRHEGALIVLLLAYHIIFWGWKGTTVGGIICQLRVVRVDGQPLRFSDALIRGLSSVFSVAALGLGCLWILYDPERQSWHDKIAGTLVVKVPKNWPLP